MSKKYTLMYNKAKIKYSPADYTLGDMVVLSTGRENRRHCIQRYSYDSEYKLYKTLSENGLCVKAFNKCDALRKFGKGSDIFTRAIPDTIQNEMSSTALLQSNHLNIGLKIFTDIIFKNVPDKMKRPEATERLIEAAITMAVILNSNKSCACDLYALCMTALCSNNYSDIHNFVPLKKALEALNEKTVTTLPLFIDMPCRFNSVELSVDSGLTGKPYGVSAYDFTKYDLASELMYSYVAGLEVLWAYSQIVDADMRKTLEALFSFGNSDCDIENFWYKTDLARGTFELSATAKKVCAMDTAERFEFYQNFLTDPAVVSKAIAHDAAIKANEPAMLKQGMAIFTGFVKELGNRNFRLTNIRILYNFVQTKGWLDDAKKSHSEDDDSGEDAFSDILGDLRSTMSSKEAEELNEDQSLMRLDEPKSPKRKGSGGTHDISTFDALDMETAKYSEARYDFSTKDVVDKTDSYKAQYNAIAEKAKLINKTFIRQLREIKVFNTGGKNTGQSSGRLDKKALYRYHYDSNIFFNNTYKQVESDLAIGIVLDQSGSMSGNGIENGRITMIVLHETLKALGINHSVIGHTSDNTHQCTIYRYQAFKEDKTYRLQKNYALANIRAEDGNCDSGSLYYMEKALLRTKNRDKICMIFSDGAPTECTGLELKNQVAHMERNGIRVIGIGIDFANIKQYYPHNANGRNLVEMLKITTDILKEYVLHKKDKN